MRQTSRRSGWTRAETVPPAAAPESLPTCNLRPKCEALVAELPKESDTKKDLIGLLKSSGSYTKYSSAFVEDTKPGPLADASTFGDANGGAEAAGDEGEENT